MISPIILSFYQTEPLLNSRTANEQRVKTSIDLGLNSVNVYLSSEGVIFPGDEYLQWSWIEKINKSKNNCYLVEGGEARKVAAFSDLTNQLYSLMPTVRAPTMLISGIPMHRIKGIDPLQDTLEKIKTVKPLTGHVLDTATGLGYTTIEATRSARHVTTIELDPVALEIARQNPWSKNLFDNPKITQRIGDSYDIVPEFENGYFSRIIHDPPAFKLAGHLYASDFYDELYRVLKLGGRLFHYVGNPESKSGRNITRGVMRRLQGVGFRNIKRQPRAFGVVAYK